MSTRKVFGPARDLVQRGKGGTPCGRGDRDDQHARHHDEHGEIRNRSPTPRAPGNRAAAERPFDETERHLREHDRHRQTHDEQPESVEAVRPDEHTYRPVPQVERIRAQPDCDEPRRAEHLRQRRRRCQHDARDQHAACQRERKEPAAVQTVGPIVGEPHRACDPDEGSQPETERPSNGRLVPAHTRRDRLPRSTRAREHTERDTDEQAHGVRIAPEVRTGRIASRSHQRVHPKRRGDCTQRAPRSRRVPAAVRACRGCRRTRAGGRCRTAPPPPTTTCARTATGVRPSRSSSDGPRSSPSWRNRTACPAPAIARRAARAS